MTIRCAPFVARKLLRVSGLLPKLTWMVLLASQEACASPSSPARLGERIAVPAQYEITDGTERRAAEDVVGILVSHSEDTVALRERPSESVRIFVLPPGTRTTARMARLPGDPWAAGDSVRVRANDRTARPATAVQFQWAVNMVQGDTLLVSGPQVHPLQAYESLGDDGARIERQTFRARPARGLLISGGVAAAGLLGWTVWPWSESGCGELLCMETSDIVGAALLGSAIGAGLLGLIAAPFAKVLGWDNLDPATLPHVSSAGGDRGLQLTWRSLPGNDP